MKACLNIYFFVAIVMTPRTKQIQTHPNSRSMSVHVLRIGKDVSRGQETQNFLNRFKSEKTKLLVGSF